MATAAPIATELMVATDISYTNLLKHYNGNYATQLPTTAGELAKGVQLYSKMRHEDQNAGWTPWSTDVTFQIAQYERWVALYDGNVVSMEAPAIAIDSNNNLYTIENYTIGEVHKQCISKWSFTGTREWCKAINGSVYSGYHSIVLDSSDNICIAGVVNINQYRASLSKWSSDGVCLWQKYISVPIREGVVKIVIDRRDNIYLISTISGATPCFSKWSPDGYCLWEKVIGNGPIYCYALGTDTSGGIYIAGDYVNRGPMLSKWASDGTLIWSRCLPTTNYPSYGAFRSLDIDSLGNIYAVGYFRDPTDYYTYPIITKWNSSGDLLWSKYLNSNSPDYFYGITIDSSNSLYTATYSGKITKWSSNGRVLWSSQLYPSICFSDIVADNYNRLYASINTGGIAAVPPIGTTEGSLVTLPNYTWRSITETAANNYSSSNTLLLSITDSSTRPALSDSTFDILSISPDYLFSQY